MNSTVGARTVLGVRLLVDVVVTLFAGAIAAEMGVLAFTLSTWTFRAFACVIAVGLTAALVRMWVGEAALLGARRRRMR